MFIPWYRVRCLRDWFTPLDGCPRCGYPYEREPGYFLMSIWAVNYGVGSVLGITLYIVIAWLFDLPIQTLMAVVLTPIFCFSILFARHSKSLFLAADLFFDPHDRGGRDGGGNQLAPPPAPDGVPTREALDSCEKDPQLR